ncbi:uncharacterized protein [Eurosta solidaginis]|uniref:uncharacterized protein n=1 Tax=Eurosta solidaginis TaxID=178769 RepID=UPI0035307EFE
MHVYSFSYARVNFLAIHHTGCSSLFVICFALLFYTPTTAYTSKQTEIVKHSITNDPSADGFWKRNVQWKSRWVKYWRPKAIYLPVWKKVWSPVLQNEWVPLPKVLPEWEVSKNGVIDSTNSDWSSSSSRSDDSSSISSRDQRAIKSYIGLSKLVAKSSGSNRSSYDSVYSTSHSGSSAWKESAKRTIISASRTKEHRMQVDGNEQMVLI